MTELEKLAQWHEKRADYFWQDKAWEPIKELADHHTDAAATIRAAMAENARLREAATELMAGSDIVMEDILWGDLPDSATGTMTMRLGAYRKVRAALNQKGPAHD